MTNYNLALSVSTVVLLHYVDQERSTACAKQLKSSAGQFGCVKLKVFGNCGVGKTALIQALKCGYIGGLLRSAFYNGRSMPTNRRLVGRGMDVVP